MQVRVVLSVVLSGLAAGCGSQATPAYYGESLGSAQGLVTNPDSVDVSGARVVANWGWVGAMFGPAKTHADVQGGFPASFSLNFFELPPEEVLFTPADEIHGPEHGDYYDHAKESRVAIAHVLAVREGTGNENDVGEIMGGDESHAILYVESDIQAGSYGEAMFQGLPKAGYHVLELEPESDAQDTLRCEANAQNVEDWKDCGLHTPVRLAGSDVKLNVRLVDDPNALHFNALYPQWLPLGAQLPDPNAKPDCDPNNPMTPFIPECQ